MNLRELILKLISSHSGFSSKRACGGMGFLISIGIVIYCTIVYHDAPDIAYALMYTSAGLLGADSVTGIFKGNSMSANTTTKKEEE